MPALLAEDCSSRCRVLIVTGCSYDPGVFRAYQAILQPSQRQAAGLGRVMEAQRELYNAALEERRGAWRWEQRSISRFEQFGELTGWEHPVLTFGVCPARGTLTRLDRAFQGFYRRCRGGGRPGFPRFKSAARWDSVEYPDSSCWRIDQQRGGAGRLHLHGVGSIRFRGSKRGLRGTPKTLTVRREGHRWRVTVFCVDVMANRREPTGKVAGIDLGVNELVATSDGQLIGNPRHLRGCLEVLADRQRLVAGRKRGSQRRRKAAHQVGRLHRKIAYQRRDLAHQVSRRLVNHYDLIVHENLEITSMVRRPPPRPNPNGGYDSNQAAAKAALNREILAAGWGLLLRMIAYKAEEAGRDIIAVNPRRTSQTRAECGHIEVANRQAAAFCCRRCGHIDHADINAARTILRAGLAHRPEREADDAA
ncbi:MAG: RNA-guided endonuclease InsQ/TnpB family protein [Acidimicrobiales bacterium]